MRQVCRYYRASECLNPNCRFAHPAEYPVYIYTVPGVEIHPDELRLAVMGNEDMAREADNAWLNNYFMFCQENVERSVDILEYPDYFCMPFDVDRVSLEIEGLKRNMGKHLGGFTNSSSAGDGFKQYDNRRQPKTYGRSKSYDGGGRGQYDRTGGGSIDAGQQNTWHSRGKTFGGPSQFTNNGYHPKTESQFGSRSSEYAQQSRKPWSSGWQDQRRYGKPDQHGGQNGPDWPRGDRQGRRGYGGNASNRAFASPSSHSNGFDRVADSSKTDLDGNDGSADYEYHNVPYNYR